MNPEEPEPDTVFKITLVPRAQLPNEYVPPIVRTAPDTYEVVRVLEEAERETAARESYRKNMSVGGDTLAQRGFKSSGIIAWAGTDPAETRP